MTIFEIYPVMIWGGPAGAFKVLTDAAYVATEGQPSLNIPAFNVAALHPEYEGAPIDSLELLVEVSIVAGVWLVYPAQTFSPGSVVTTPCDPLQFLPKNGRWSPAMLDLGVCRSIRVSAKRTGGGPDSALRLWLAAAHRRVRRS